jgi:Leucine-rich repeat (LRR) protein
MKNLYLLLIFTFCSLFLQAQVSEQEFQALKTFYNATGGNQWTKKTGWQNINTTATAGDVTSSWTGLEVTGGHVIKIGLNSNNLVGYLPSAIGNLTWLKYFEVEGIKLEGAIPQEIGNLINLEGINLSGNRFTGPLPASMANLVKLKYVYLSNNPLNIPFPADLVKSWPNLEIFYGSECGFTSNLPDIFNKLPKLEMFYLINNQMTGEIPASLGKIKTLYEIDLSRNAFSGSLPSLDSCKALRNILLNNNQFTGFIPASYSGLVTLRSLHIYNNNLSGTIPAGLFNTPLERIYASNNFYTFESIEPHIIKINNLLTREFETNKLFPLKQSVLSVNSGEALSLSAASLSVYVLGGNNNRYKWFRNNTEVYSGNDPSFSVASAGTAHAGVYRFEVTNTVVTDITLKSENITVSVLVAGNKAPTDITLSTTSVSENYTGVAGVLSATDGDTGDTHNFLLATGNGTNDKDNALFSITGNNLVMKTGADFETKPVLNLLVTANDLKGGNFTKSMTIQVTNINEAPAFSGQILSTTIDETAPTGHIVLLLLAKDPEGSAVTYSITQGNEGGAFAIEGNKLVVADNTKLKYDTQNQYTLKVSASDGTLSATAQLVVSLSKINKMPTVDNATFTIPENSVTGTVVGSVTGSDPEGVPLAYLILSGNTDNAFRLTGNQITVNTAAAVDYDARTSFSLIVNATDGISNVQATITINLTNLVDETGNDILSFTIPGLVESPVIDVPNRTIKARVENVTLGALKADFILSKGASSNPATGSVFNFASSQTIRVTSEKGVSSDWQIRVTIPSPARTIEGLSVKVYPNPATESLHISGLQGTTTLRLMDSAGRMLQRLETASSTETISLTGRVPGLYLLSVESAQGRSTYKIIRK